jgi:hypothetical protein
LIFVVIAEVIVSVIVIVIVIIATAEVVAEIGSRILLQKFSAIFVVFKLILTRNFFFEIVIEVIVEVIFIKIFKPLVCSLITRHLDGSDFGIGGSGKNRGYRGVELWHEFQNGHPAASSFGDKCDITLNQAKGNLGVKTSARLDTGISVGKALVAADVLINQVACLGHPLHGDKVGKRCVFDPVL